MRLALTGRHVEITPGLRRLVAKKIARLDRVLNTKAVSGQVELWLEKFRHVAEVHVHARGGHMLKGRAVATAWEEALTEAVDRIVQQAQKLKGKWQERKREARARQAQPRRAVHQPRAGAAHRPVAAVSRQADDDRGRRRRRRAVAPTRSSSSATPAPTRSA